MNREKVLLLVVLGLLGGVYGMGGKYDPVPVPSPSSPSELPPLVEVAVPGFRAPGPPPVRSLLDEFSELAAPELTTLPDFPAIPIPVASPPVRPGPALWAAPGLRCDLVEAAEAEVEVTPDEAAAAAAATAAGAAPPPEEKPKEAPPLDMAKFDWIATPGALGHKVYGHIEIDPRDAEKGPQAKFLLLIDPSMEFRFRAIDEKTGRDAMVWPQARARTDKLGFADLIENAFWTEAFLKGIADARGLLPTAAEPTLRALADWIAEKSEGPKYDRLLGLEHAGLAYRGALRQKPDPGTVRLLGRIYRRSYRLDEELALYGWHLERQTIARDPEFLFLRGEVQEELGLADAARREYEESLLARPDPAVRLRLGQLLLRSDRAEDLEDAAKAFEAAASQATSPQQRVEATLGLAQALLAVGEGAKADLALDRVSPADRGAEWLLTRGAVLYGQPRSRGPDLAGARGHFEGALSKSPGEPRARTALAVVMARIAAAASDAKERADGLRKAAETADLALGDDALNYYWPLVAKAWALRAAGERSRAVENLQEAVAALPGEAYGRYLLGVLLLRDGLAAEARTQFLEAARIAPGFPDALAGVGLAGGGPPGEAAEYLRRAAQLEPGYPLWPFLAARVALADEGVPLPQRLEEARRDLAAILERPEGRTFAPAYALLSEVLYYQGQAGLSLDRMNDAGKLLTPVTPANKPLADWIAQARDKVDRWLGTRIWRDDFKRRASNTVGRGWKEDEKAGAQVTLVEEGEGAVLISGRHKVGEAPRVWRSWGLEKVLSCELAVTVAPNELCDVYLSLIAAPQGAGNKENASLHLWKGTGGVKFGSRKQQNEPEITWEDIPGFKWPENGGPVAFGFVRRDSKEDKGEITVTLNGAVLKTFDEFLGFAKTRRGDFRVEMRCDASSGSKIEARLEWVETWLDIR